MTVDDVLAYLASRPKRERPANLKSDSAMLKSWLLLRRDQEFQDDIIGRYGLHTLDRAYLNQRATDPSIEHAIGNAWGHAVQVLREPKSTTHVGD